MAQVKIYGLQAQLAERREAISAAIHDALMVAFGLPEEKRFHRFIGLEAEDFLYPADRSKSYTILEISVFSGRSDAAKRRLIGQLYDNFRHGPGIGAQDLEITLFETPLVNWGIRGVSADRLRLNYSVFC